MENRDIHVLKKGKKLNNRYVIDEILGEGGFGITYSGQDELLAMKVAIKEYYPHGFVTRNNMYDEVITVTQTKYDDIFQKGKQKFLKEARSLARFNKEEGIVNVTDFFEENNTAYIVMEYLDGITLKEYLKQNGVMSAQDVQELMTPLIRSLDAVHKSGLIHRDISPDNIMLLMNGKVKLMDFGAARDYTEAGEKSLSIVLKHGYAPEEQYRSHGIQGPWTDIYALSATMYKCITGITPAESIQRIIEDTVQPPSALGIPIPSGMEYALMKGLSISQKNRYQNLNDFCQDFYRQSYSPADETVYEPNYNQNYQQNYNQSYEPNYNSSYESGYHSGYVPPTPPPQKKGKGGWIALITGSLLFVVLGVSILVMTTLNKKEEAVSLNNDAVVLNNDSSGSDTQPTEEPTTEAATTAATEATTEATTQAVPEPKSLPYVDNAYMDESACLSPNSYQVVSSGDGSFSFGYPKYMFNGCYINEQENYFDLYYSDSYGYEAELYVYEEDNPGDPVLNAQKLYNRYVSQIDKVYFRKVSEKSDDQGMARALIGGRDINTGLQMYVIAANNGVKNYILEYRYPDPDINYEYDDSDYIVDCIYRYCSFGGGTYKPRNYQQFLKDDMGEKK